VPALPSSILEPLWIQFAALLPTHHDAHPLGCHRPRIPTGSSSTSSFRSWCSAAATAASPTTAARRPRCAAAATNGSPRGSPSSRAWPYWPPTTGCSAWRWSKGSNARWLPRRVASRWRRWRPRPTAATTGCWLPPWTPSPSSARRPRGPRCTWTPATTISPAGRCWRHGHGRPDRQARRAGTGPGGAPLGYRAHSRPGQPVRQAALVHRTLLLVVEFWLALALAVMTLGRLIRRAWTHCRWEGRPRRCP
jgi:hypothetical protein